MKRRAAGELNVFTVGQAYREPMHKAGEEPDVPSHAFLPLSRLVDVSYDRVAANKSLRRAHTSNFQHRASKRQWVNGLDVILDTGPQPWLQAVA